MFLISNAYADAGQAPASGIMSFLPMFAFIAILYFLLIRPQQKRAKKSQAMIASLKKGDKVLTVGGIFACVAKIVDNEVTLEVSDGVFCKFAKSAISSIVGDKQAGSEGCCSIAKGCGLAKESSKNQPANSGK